MTQNEFTIDIPGEGAFTFAKRNMRKELQIQAEYSRLTEGVDTPTSQLEMLAGIMSTLKVLTISAPKGWVLDELDPLDPDSYSRLLAVHAALRQKEGSFRRPGTEAESQGDRTAVG